jgi:uncharacterized protein
MKDDMNTGQSSERNRFYAELATHLDQKEVLSTTIVEHGGYGLDLKRGNVLRIRQTQGAQIVDLCLANAADPTEHYASGTQVSLEGLSVTRFTPIWGTPPATRRIATCIADTVVHRDNPAYTRDHASHGAHCNPHHLALFANRHPDTCYDNLRAGMAMVGLSQLSIHDNMNLFENCTLEPYTGHYFLRDSDAEPGDCIAFYAEIDLLAVLSLCPYGSGGDMDEDWHTSEVPVHPVAIDVIEGGIGPSAGGAE